MQLQVLFDQHPIFVGRRGPFTDSSSDDEDDDRPVMDGQRRVRGIGLFEDNDDSSDEDEDLWDEETRFNSILQRLKANERVSNFEWSGEQDFIQNVTDEKWEEIGRDISNNTFLKDLSLHTGALNDRKMTSLFRGLTKSSSIRHMDLNTNQLTAVGVRSMVPFLQHADNLTYLDLDRNNLQSEGFNVMFRSLRNSPIERLICSGCGIASIEIRCIPKDLKVLSLDENSIGVDGCRALAKLLQGDATLTGLSLSKNNIDDDGVEILVGVLQSNTSLTHLYLTGNDGISTRGKTMLLKLVNDISSIEATLRSNHTLSFVGVDDMGPHNNFVSFLNTNEDLYVRVLRATTNINSRYKEPEATGREKVIETQLNSERRAQLAGLQGVNQSSVYSDINPLHLPEVLSIVGRELGEGELYLALKSSILELIPTVNRKACILQERDVLTRMAELLNARVEELNAELAAIEAVEGGAVLVGSESRSSKRRRQA